MSRSWMGTGLPRGCRLIQQGRVARPLRTPGVRTPGVWPDGRLGVQGGNPLRARVSRLLVCGALVAAGFAQTASAQRLPDVFTPNHYTLWFDPDLRAETFRGRTTIDGQLTRSTSSITLHAAELTFETVRILADERTDTARVQVDPTAETVTLTVSRPLRPGAVRIEFLYSGILSDSLRGFYMSKANGRGYAVTQMEPTDARRAFPGIDEPAYKATFDISVTADASDTVLSNARQISDAQGPGYGRHTVTFARTEKMSTYLVAMVVGDFVCREAQAGATPIRACSTPDKLALTEYALETARQQLLFFNDYFGIPYAFDKLDIIAVPDFSAGAMENAGAITFRERLLLVDPERSSIEVRKGVASTIAHELAHQWFGNLVTMKWWDDIWLNEGFATWLSSKPLAAAHPEWRIDLAEAERTQSALGIDALQSTRPIRLRVNTPQEIGQVFDGIAYGKTASVLRMIEAYVGPALFRDAIRSYLRRFAFGNAAGEDFWTEMTRVTGRPIDRVLRGFVDQPGAPVVSVRSTCRGTEAELFITQSRFSGSPHAAVPEGAPWSLPICSRSPDGMSRCDLIEDRSVAIRAPQCDQRVINAEGVGYFFSEYAPETVRAFSSNASALSPTERLRLLGDEWWMVRAGRQDIGVYLDLAEALVADQTPEVLEAIAERLSFTREYLVTPAQQPAFDRWVRSRFRPELDTLGWPGSADDAGDRQNRRATLLRLVGLTGDDPEIQQRAATLVREYMLDASVLPPTLASTVLRVAARSGDRRMYDAYIAQAAALKARPEEYYRYLGALSSFRDLTLVRRTLDLALSPEVRAQDTAAIVAGVLGSSWGRDAAWAFIQAEWPAFTRKVDVFQGLPGIISALGAFCSTGVSEQIATFFRARDIAAASRSLRRATERIDSCAAQNARQSEPLDAWLASRTR